MGRKGNEDTYEVLVVGFLFLIFLSAMLSSLSGESKRLRIEVRLEAGQKGEQEERGKETSENDFDKS